MNVDDRRRGPRRAPKPEPLPSTGEEILALAGRAGLDAHSAQHLRRLMFDWSQRFRRRLSTSAEGIPDEALMALTVSYLRRLRKGEQRRASGG